MKRILLIAFILAFGLLSTEAQNLSPAERQLIAAGDTAAALPVYQITDADEYQVLRAMSEEVNPADPLLKLLARRMYLAMRDTARPGVGIAAPQVGVNRNAIWVQRFDKPGFPFEFYINPQIVSFSKMLRKGPEGCLSIPGERGDVLRSYAITLKYQDFSGEWHTEMIEDFTAVIFQHECDHLKGVLFTDRIEQQKEMALFPLTEESGLFIGR